MILKEAFRYQNFLTTLLNNAQMYLRDTTNITERKQTHLRSAANPDAADEVTIAQKNTVFDNDEITPTVIIRFYMDILNEKENLTNAISAAKKALPVDMDAVVAMNKVRQNMISTYKTMANLKGGERQTIGSDMKFNAEGNQVSYRYTVNEVTKIDYDRNLVKSLVKKLTEQADKVSAEIDMLNITTEIAHAPKYDIDDSFEDCIVKYMAQ